MEKIKNNAQGKRKKQILQYMEEHGGGQIRDFSSVLNVSEATVRRDLTELHEAGEVIRTHGGAVLADIKSTSFEHKYREKSEIMMDEKKRIGVYAASLVADGNTIFLDSGTTTYCIASNLLHKKNITVITYDLYIANAIELDVSSTLLVTGGSRRHGHGVLVGPITRNFIEGLRVDKTFLAADALDVDFGVSNANFYESDLKSLIVASGQQVILTADHTKFGKVALSRVCNLRNLDLIITDSGLKEDMRKKMIESGVEMQCV